MDSKSAKPNPLHLTRCFAVFGAIIRCAAGYLMLVVD
jgi:hypothetical protein